MPTKKNSLVENINRRKRAGTSRPKSKSTISREAYLQMEHGWPQSRKAEKKAAKPTKKVTKKATLKGPKKAAKKRRSSR